MDENSIKVFIGVFTSVVYEAFPFIVLGSVIAGFLEELVPQQFIARVIPRNHFLAIGMSCLLGIVFPMCECGIIPVMRRLLRKGLPLSCCVAYILAGPIINPIVMLSTYTAFFKYEEIKMGSFWMVGLRVGMGYLVAFVTASLVEFQYRKYGFRLLAPLAIPPGVADPSLPAAPAASSPNPDDQETDDPSERRTVIQRINGISETALHDFTDIMVFLIIGALLTAFLRAAFQESDSTQFTNPFLATAFMMFLAVAMCLCSEADAFVGANIANVPAAAKLAFLVLGPMFDLKLYLMYTRVFRPRLIWTIVPCVMVQVYVYSILVHFFWVSVMIPRLTPP